MPDLLNRSADDMLAAMAAQFETKWPNPWWPKGISAYDDCAACVSFYLFGLNSLGNPFYSYVSQVQTWGRNLGVWHAGSAGVRRGDVLAFDWDGDGDPDHTEIVVSVSSNGSIVTSRGTNSNPGDDMRDRTRSAGYILSYIRPPYPGTTTAGTGTSTPISQEDDMFSDQDREDLTYVVNKTKDYDGAFGEIRANLNKLLGGAREVAPGVRLQQLQTVAGVAGGWYYVVDDASLPAFGARYNIGQGVLTLTQRRIAGEELNTAEQQIINNAVQAALAMRPSHA
ncbi:hypothetical protein LLS1_18410 [Leifsonia sp. LS1]|uniref:CHAP domain-containing protein n=1 Tax=Leifsonia sp. LS1 TaxID=2828483 RepID=UPI001CFEAEF4|nr:CHAP domain-containing protein [Leifsonia sp. LS1]GIT80172.1 hypothetical protein LLS1_18410 [Leifsonia sp. LS1]